MVKISAVMALYNTPYDYLKTTVESILNQTFKDFELIIIDDASSIEYSEFFKNFGDERIQYFKLDKNSGPGHARNEGIKKAQGEYIAITDSDDIYMPKRFELQAQFLDQNQDISLIGCVFRASNRKKPSSMPLKDEDIKIFMLFNSILNNSTIMFRKDIFAQKNLFYSEDIHFGEDYELWIKVMFSGIKMANLEDYLMVYTRRQGQLSKTGLENQILILKQIYKKIFLNMGLDASDEELDLHYNIDTQNFKNISSSEKILSWFNKIIESNKNIKIFNEEKLLIKKNQVLAQYYNFKDRLFKIKIGQYNICLSKKPALYIEKRN